MMKASQLRMEDEKQRRRKIEARGQFVPLCSCERKARHRKGVIARTAGMREMT